MVLERNGRGPISARRRLERAEVHVCGLRCEGSVRAGAWLRLPAREVRSAAAACGDRARPRSTRWAVTAGSEHPSPMTSSRCIDRQYAYDRAPLNAVVEATEEAETWREAHRRIRRRLRRRAHARASLPAEERFAAVSDRRLLSRRRTHFTCDRAATCRWRRSTSSSGADGRSSIRSKGNLRAGAAGRRGTERRTRASRSRGRETSDAPSTISKRDRTSIRPGSRSTA